MITGQFVWTVTNFGSLVWQGCQGETETGGKRDGTDFQ